MRTRIGTVCVGGIPLPVYEIQGFEHYAEYVHASDGTHEMRVRAGMGRHMLVSSLVHEIWHAVEDLELGGVKRVTEELRAQLIGAALAGSFAEIERMAKGRKP